MNPTHHPEAELLLRYGSGALAEPQALLVACHLAFCSECRNSVAAAESIGGALLDGIAAPVEPAAALEARIAQTLARAGEAATPGVGAPAVRGAARRIPANTTFPSPLRAYLADPDRVPWKALGPGIHHSVVARSADGSTARLLKIAPGRSVFEHGHAGTELTLVLAGAYRAGGQRFVRGDVECADDAINHRPVAEPVETCICLAVTDAPLRFRNLLGRIMQPFLGI